MLSKPTPISTHVIPKFGSFGRPKYLRGCQRQGSKRSDPWRTKISNIKLLDFWVACADQITLPLSPAETPAGYSNKNSNNRKTASSLSPSHRPPRAFFFPPLVSQSPYDTRKSSRPCCINNATSNVKMEGYRLELKLKLWIEKEPDLTDFNILFEKS